MIIYFQLANHHISALPILRKLGAQGSSSMLRSGDFSMLKLWVGLEARTFLQASIESVSNLLSWW